MYDWREAPPLWDNGQTPQALSADIGVLAYSDQRWQRLWLVLVTLWGASPPNPPVLASLGIGVEARGATLSRRIPLHMISFERSEARGVWGAGPP